MRVKRILLVATTMFLGGTSALLGSPSGVRADDTAQNSIEPGTRAKPIKRPPVRYPSREAQRGIEGWVQVSYVVNPDGSVGEILIEDSSGRKSFEKEALRAMRRWRFEPATMNGEPIEQCHTKVLLNFEMRQLARHRGARQRFIKEYKQANQLLIEGKLPEARIAIDEIAEQSQATLYESSRLWILRSMLQAKEGDDLGQLSSLIRSTSAGGEYVEPSLYVTVMLNILELETQSQRYADALGSIEVLDDLDLDDGMAAQVDRIRHHIEGLKTADQPLAIAGEIGEAREEHHGAGMWRHTLLRRTAGVEAITGTLESVELRCEWRRIKAKPEKDRAWRVPPEWGDCTIYVFGEPGSTFQLLEYSSTAL